MKQSSNHPAIRKAVLQDAEALKLCIDRAYAPVKQRLKDLPDVSGGLEAEITDNHVYVAEANGKTLACLVVSLNRDTVHLANVAVDPDAKGKGLGRQMMDFAEDFARRHGATEICLATHVKMPENVALYQHLGWHETSRTGNKVLMKKDL